jgi:hypothetical protein
MLDMIMKLGILSRNLSEMYCLRCRETERLVTCHFLFVDSVILWLGKVPLSEKAHTSPPNTRLYLSSENAGEPRDK